MLEVIDDIVPIGNPDWERVWDRHNARYPQKEWTAESLRRKYKTLVKKKMKTGDPNCPPHIRYAKRIYRKIIAATDSSYGESNKDKDDDDDKDDNDDEEEDDVYDNNYDDDDGSGGGGGGGVRTHDFPGDMIRDQHERNGDRPIVPC